MLREVWKGRIWTARAATVVEDRGDRTLLYVAPGMRWKCPVNPDGSWQRVPSGRWVLGDRVWRGKHVLSVAWPEVAHAVLLYWDEAWRFLGWYVNLQEPLRPTPIGFDYMDHVLDIEVEPDGSWAWKDERELAASVQHGIFSAEEADRIRAEGDAAVARLRAREEPFDETWLGWRPDPSWRVPELAPGWDRIDPTG